ncbi:LysR family transcriptional regulator [Actomonas aquatica]|uniref:LysR family transcriptional regulator n=1 Tax=Actomonas aquatica TaxID=2866162 RepID=A0ABZ1C920_9BACT|nr:LysR family transcriptional regulator [Opitutus sp. WL0086]WRQ87817.1 LysR family transcriptional regulator [Opitutus sp. WL0086]
MKTLRTFFAVMEEGSVNRAAARLGVAQPTLSRQIQALEQEVGGSLFERGTWGVRPTDLGFKLREMMLPVLRAYDQAWAEVAAHAKGRHTQLRVGYLGMAANRFLNPALARLREEYPDIKLWLFDQTPVEQLKALRAGELDVALIGQEGAAVGDDFYRRKVSRIGVCAALPSQHPAAKRESISLEELKHDVFIGVAESSVPGRNAWVASLCAKAGFKARFVAETSEVTETFMRVVGDSAACIVPDYVEGSSPPGITFVKLNDDFATWDFYVLRQRGRGTPAIRRLVELIGEP